MLANVIRRLRLPSGAKESRLSRKRLCSPRFAGRFEAFLPIVAPT